MTFVKTLVIETEKKETRNYFKRSPNSEGISNPELIC